MSNLNVPPVDVNSILPKEETVQFNNAPIIEPINPVNNVLDNSFKVSDQPNIFDNLPNNSFAISQEELNKPIESVENNILTNNQNVFNDANAFEQKPLPVNEEKSNNVVENKEVSQDSINEDIILAQIAIEESNVKHYEALAENSKKKIELLKRQVKKKQDEVNLENTASNLFNNNGVLDEEKVLGKTPMPNIMAA